MKRFPRESPANSRQNSVQETGSSSSNLSLNRKQVITARRNSGDFSGKTLSEVKSQMKSRRLAPNFGSSFDYGDQSPPSDPNEPEEVKTPVPVPRVKFELVEKKPEVPAYCGPPVMLIKDIIYFLKFSKSKNFAKNKKMFRKTLRKSEKISTKYSSGCFLSFDSNPN